MLIAEGNLRAGTLAGRVAVVTGAGGGIGFEAARALLWLGARVALAEVDVAAGQAAAERLASAWAPDRFAFMPTDVSDESSVRALARAVEERLGPVDIVVNTATVATVGQTVAELPIQAWDRSYGVNLRGPALLARAFLPGMLERRCGVFVLVSSTGGPFMASYETLKAAQVALGASLDAELEGTGVVAFTIGPGLVPTDTAVAAVRLLAPRMGMTLPEFYAMNRGALVSVEAAGAGFAVAVAMAERYAGQEISSPQALIDAGIAVPEDGCLPPGIELPPVQSKGAEPEAAEPDAAEPEADEPDAAERDAAEPGSGWPAAPTIPAAAGFAHAVRVTLEEQSAGWKKRSFFERQWMLRDFKQRGGMPVERWLETLARLDEQLAAGGTVAAADRPPLEKLAAYYGHMADLARGYVKDARQRDEQVGIVLGWQREVEALIDALR